MLGGDGDRYEVSRSLFRTHEAIGLHKQRFKKLLLFYITQLVEVDTDLESLNDCIY